RSMSSRERWTVYPLLFLTLGIAVKDKLPPRRVTADQIIARSMLITEHPNDHANDRSPPGQLSCQRGVVMDRELEPQVVLDSNARGGIVDARGPQFPDILLGHAEGRTGPMAGILLLYPNAAPVPLTAVQPTGPPRTRAGRAAAEKAAAERAVAERA